MSLLYQVTNCTTHDYPEYLVSATGTQYIPYTVRYYHGPYLK